MRRARKAPLLFATAFALAVAAAAPADDAVHASAAEVEPLAVGAVAPTARVADVDGNPVELADILRGRGVLLVFYRGGW